MPFLFDDKVLVAVAPRAGYHTMLGISAAAQKQGINVKKENLDYKGTKIIKIKLVRNPFNRAVSSFMILSNPVLKLYRIPPLRLTYEQHHDFTFRMFLEKLKGANMNGINHHIADQNEIDEGKSVKFDRIIKSENMFGELSEEFKAVGIKLDFKNLGVQNRLSRCSDVFEGKCADMSLKELNKWASSRGNVYPPYYAFYDEGTHALVKEIFKRDLLDYEMPFL